VVNQTTERGAKKNGGTKKKSEKLPLARCVWKHSPDPGALDLAELGRARSRTKKGDEVNRRAKIIYCGHFTGRFQSQKWVRTTPPHPNTPALCTYENESSAGGRPARRKATESRKEEEISKAQPPSPAGVSLGRAARAKSVGEAAQKLGEKRIDEKERRRGARRPCRRRKKKNARRAQYGDRPASGCAKATAILVPRGNDPHRDGRSPGKTVKEIKKWSRTRRASKFMEEKRRKE